MWRSQSDDSTYTPTHVERKPRRVFTNVIVLLLLLLLIIAIRFDADIFHRNPDECRRSFASNAPKRRVPRPRTVYDISPPPPLRRRSRRLWAPPPPTVSQRTRSRHHHSNPPLFPLKFTPNIIAVGKCRMSRHYVSTSHNVHDTANATWHAV